MRREDQTKNKVKEEKRGVLQKIASLFSIASSRAFANNNIEGSQLQRGVHSFLDGLRLQPLLNSAQEKGEKNDHCHSLGSRGSMMQTLCISFF